MLGYCTIVDENLMKSFGMAKVFCPGELEREGYQNQYGPWTIRQWLGTHKQRYDIRARCHLLSRMSTLSCQSDLASASYIVSVRKGKYGKGSYVAIEFLSYNGGQIKYAPRKTGVYNIVLK